MALACSHLRVAPHCRVEPKRKRRPRPWSRTSARDSISTASTSSWFPPKGWADCNGQLLSIAQNQALFSLLGTTYGGNGQTTFALPDLRGRAPIHFGQGPGTSQYDLGQMGGTETVTLQVGEMPAHTHALRVDNANGTTAAANGAYLARDPAGTPAYGNGSAGALANAAVATVGASQPHNNLPPYTTIRYCIALIGIYPQQN